MGTSVWIRRFLLESPKYLQALACTASASFYILDTKEQSQVRRPEEWQLAARASFSQSPPQNTQIHWARLEQQQ